MMFPVLWQVLRRSWFTPGYPKSDLSVFFLWRRSPCARAVSGSLHTGAILTALSAGGASGSLPTGSLPSFLLQDGSSSFESSSLLLKLEVTPKWP